MNRTHWHPHPGPGTLAPRRRRGPAPPDPAGIRHQLRPRRRQRRLLRRLRRTGRHRILRLSPARRLSHAVRLPGRREQRMGRRQRHRRRLQRLMGPSWRWSSGTRWRTRGCTSRAALGYSYADPTTEISTSGFAGSAGAGYDLRLGRNFALTPYINYLQQFGGTLSYTGGIDTGVDAKVHLFQFGLGFTWF